MDELASPKRTVGERRTRMRTVADGPSGFYTMVTGQIESATFPELDNLFCRYSFSYGPEWRIMQGIDQGFSQVARKGTSGDASVVWNFPVDITFKSTNPFGWPRLVVSVYSQDFFGRYVIRGYGSVLLPTTPGRYVRYIRTFAPVSSSLLQSLLSWLTGNHPEFYDARLAAAGKGREVVRTTSTGVVRVAFNVVTKGMASHGYTNGAPPDSPDLDENTPPLAMPHFGAGPMPPVSSTVGAGLGGGMSNSASSTLPQPPLSRRSTSNTSSSNSATGTSMGGVGGGSGGLNASAFAPSSSSAPSVSTALAQPPPADSSEATAPPTTSSGAAAALNASGGGERRKGGSKRSSREASRERGLGPGGGLKGSLIPPSIDPVDDISSEGKN